MRQFANVSYSPWAYPYSAPTNTGKDFYGTSSTPQQPAYRRIVLPPAPIFYHPGVEQVIGDSDDDESEAGPSGVSLDNPIVEAPAPSSVPEPLLPAAPSPPPPAAEPPSDIVPESVPVEASPTPEPASDPAPGDSNQSAPEVPPEVEHTAQQTSTDGNGEDQTQAHDVKDESPGGSNGDAATSSPTECTPAIANEPSGTAVEPVEPTVDSAGDGGAALVDDNSIIAPETTTNATASEPEPAPPPVPAPEPAGEEKSGECDQGGNEPPKSPTSKSVHFSPDVKDADAASIGSKKKKDEKKKTKVIGKGKVNAFVRIKDAPPPPPPKEEKKPAKEEKKPAKEEKKPVKEEKKPAKEEKKPAKEEKKKGFKDIKKKDTASSHPKEEKREVDEKEAAVVPAKKKLSKAEERKRKKHEEKEKKSKGKKGKKGGDSAHADDKPPSDAGDAKSEVPGGDQQTEISLDGPVPGSETQDSPPPDDPTPKPAADVQEPKEEALAKTPSDEPAESAPQEQEPTDKAPLAEADAIAEPEASADDDTHEPKTDALSQGVSGGDVTEAADVADESPVETKADESNEPVAASESTGSNDDVETSNEPASEPGDEQPDGEEAKSGETLAEPEAAANEAGDVEEPMASSEPVLDEAPEVRPAEIQESGTLAEVASESEAVAETGSDEQPAAIEAASPNIDKTSAPTDDTSSGEDQTPSVDVSPSAADAAPPTVVEQPQQDGEHSQEPPDPIDTESFHLEANHESAVAGPPDATGNIEVSQPENPPQDNSSAGDASGGIPDNTLSEETEAVQDNIPEKINDEPPSEALLALNDASGQEAETPPNQLLTENESNVLSNNEESEVSTTVTVPDDTPASSEPTHGDSPANLTEELSQEKNSEPEENDDLVDSVEVSNETSLRQKEDIDAAEGPTVESNAVLDAEIGTSPVEEANTLPTVESESEDSSGSNVEADVPASTTVVEGDKEDGAGPSEDAATAVPVSADDGEKDQVVVSPAEDAEAPVKSVEELVVRASTNNDGENQECLESSELDAEVDMPANTESGEGDAEDAHDAHPQQSADDVTESQAPEIGDDNSGGTSPELTEEEPPEEVTIHNASDVEHADCGDSAESAEVEMNNERADSTQFSDEPEDVDTASQHDTESIIIQDEGREEVPGEDETVDEERDNTIDTTAQEEHEASSSEGVEIAYEDTCEDVGDAALDTTAGEVDDTALSGDIEDSDITESHTPEVAGHNTADQSGDSAEPHCASSSDINPQTVALDTSDQTCDIEAPKDGTDQGQGVSIESSASEDSSTTEGATEQGKPKEAASTAAPEESIAIDKPSEPSAPELMEDTEADEATIQAFIQELLEAAAEPVSEEPSSADIQEPAAGAPTADQEKAQDEVASDGPREVVADVSTDESTDENLAGGIAIGEAVSLTNDPTLRPEQAPNDESEILPSALNKAESDAPPEEAQMEDQKDAAEATIDTASTPEAQTSADPSEAVDSEIVAQNEEDFSEPTVEEGDPVSESKSVPPESDAKSTQELDEETNPANADIVPSPDPESIDIEVTNTSDPAIDCEKDGAADVPENLTSSEPTPVDAEDVPQADGAAASKVTYLPEPPINNRQSCDVNLPELVADSEDIVGANEHTPAALDSSPDGDDAHADIPKHQIVDEKTATDIEAKDETTDQTGVDATLDVVTNAVEQETAVDRVDSKEETDGTVQDELPPESQVPPPAPEPPQVDEEVADVESGEQTLEPSPPVGEELRQEPLNAKEVLAAEENTTDASESSPAVEEPKDEESQPQDGQESSEPQQEEASTGQETENIASEASEEVGPSAIDDQPQDGKTDVVKDSQPTQELEEVQPTTPSAESVPEMNEAEVKEVSIPSDQPPSERQPDSTQEEPLPQPNPEDSQPEPASEESQPEPASEELCPESAPEQSQPEPPSEESQPKPPSEESQPEPPSEESQPEPPPEESQPEPPSEESQPEPPSEESQPEPPSEESQPEPPSEESQPEPPSEESQPEPPSEQSQPEPPSRELQLESAPEESQPEPAPEEPQVEENEIQQEGLPVQENAAGAADEVVAPESNEPKPSSDHSIEAPNEDDAAKNIPERPKEEVDVAPEAAAEPNATVENVPEKPVESAPEVVEPQAEQAVDQSGYIAPEGQLLADETTTQPRDVQEEVTNQATIENPATQVEAAQDAAPPPKTPPNDSAIIDESAATSSPREKHRRRHSHSHHDGKHRPDRRRESNASTKERPALGGMALAAAKFAGSIRNKRHDSMTERDLGKGKERTRELEDSSSSKERHNRKHRSHRHRDRGEDKEGKQRTEEDVERRRRHEARRAERERTAQEDDARRKEEAARIEEEEEARRKKRREERRARKAEEEERVAREAEEKVAREAEEQRVRHERRRLRQEAEKEVRRQERESAAQAARDRAEQKEEIRRLRHVRRAELEKEKLGSLRSKEPEIEVPEPHDVAHRAAEEDPEVAPVSPVSPRAPTRRNTGERRRELPPTPRRNSLLGGFSLFNRSNTEPVIPTAKPLKPVHRVRTNPVEASSKEKDRPTSSHNTERPHRSRRHSQSHHHKRFNSAAEEAEYRAKKEEKRASRARDTEIEMSGGRDGGISLETPIDDAVPLPPPEPAEARTEPFPELEEHPRSPLVDEAAATAGMASTSSAERHDQLRRTNRRVSIISPGSEARARERERERPKSRRMSVTEKERPVSRRTESDRPRSSRAAGAGEERIRPRRSETDRSGRKKKDDSGGIKGFFGGLKRIVA